ncbi:MAG: hypothetical protein WKG07_03460 [Hymenobacter sp.]
MGPAPTDPNQPNTYGGNFGNDVQDVLNDPARASNQRADANRGELGVQGTLGGTHGGFGNQYREFDTAAERPAAEATEEKYYGQGAQKPGLQDNAYRAYDGRDERPSQQGHAVRDTPPPPTMNFGDNIADRQTDGRGNTQDNRNLPGKTGPAAAFQNDNGAPTVGDAYAPDYGHTSGVGLPPGTPDNHVSGGPGGRNQSEDQHSSRGGYDNQGSQGGRSHDQQPGGPAPAGQGAPAPVNAPDAPKTPATATVTAAARKPSPATPPPATRAAASAPAAPKRVTPARATVRKAALTTTRTPVPAAPNSTSTRSRTTPKTTATKPRKTTAPTTATSPKTATTAPPPPQRRQRLIF